MSNQLQPGDLFKKTRPICGMTPAEREAKLWKLRDAISLTDQLRNNLRHQAMLATQLKRRLKSQLEELL